MKTGVELIAEERQSQINQHGFTEDHDDMYCNWELAQAAKYCLTLNDKDYPEEWGDWFRSKVKSKPYKDRLAYAGALIAAQIDLEQRNEVKAS